MNDIEMKASVEITCNKCGTISSPPISNKDLEDNEFITITCSKCGLTKEVSSKEIIEMVKKKAVEEIQKYYNSK